jgi:hypothetical protein
MQSSAWLLRYKCDLSCFVCIIGSKFAVRRVASLLRIRKDRVQISAQKVSALADTCCGFLQCLQENAEIESQNRSRHITGYVVCYSDGNRVMAIQFVASNFTRPLSNSWNYSKHIKNNNNNLCLFRAPPLRPHGNWGVEMEVRDKLFHLFMESKNVFLLMSSVIPFAIELRTRSEKKWEKAKRSLKFLTDKVELAQIFLPSLRYYLRNCGPYHSVYSPYSSILGITSGMSRWNICT